MDLPGLSPGYENPTVDQSTFIPSCETWAGAVVRFSRPRSTLHLRLSLLFDNNHIRDERPLTGVSMRQCLTLAEERPGCAARGHWRGLRALRKGRTMIEPQSSQIQVSRMKVSRKLLVQSLTPAESSGQLSLPRLSFSAAVELTEWAQELDRQHPPRPAPLSSYEEGASPRVLNYC